MIIYTRLMLEAALGQAQSQSQSSHGALSYSLLAPRATDAMREVYQVKGLGDGANITDLVICIFSFIGSLVIIIPYAMNKNSRKLRHALILGLATSDLVSSTIIIITTACVLGNVNLIQERGLCQFLGFMLGASIFTQHLWNLSIAIVTYMILVKPLSTFTLTVERRLVWLWPLYWSLALAIHGIIWAPVNYGFRGGYCTYGSRGYFAPVFQFVPRAVVVVVILVLYTHLFFFLRRTNLFKAVSSISRSRGSRAGPSANLVGGGLDSNAAHPPSASGNTASDATVLAAMDSTRSSTTDPASGSNTSKKSVRARFLAVLNKGDQHAQQQDENEHELELVELEPTQQVDQAAPAPAPAVAVAQVGSRTIEEKQQSLAPPASVQANRSRSASDPPLARITSASTTASSAAVGEGASQGTAGGNKSQVSLNESGSVKQSSRPSTGDPLRTTSSSNRHAYSKGGHRMVRRRASFGDSSESDDADMDEYTFTPMQPRKDVGDFDMITPPREHLKHLNAPKIWAKMSDVLAMDGTEMPASAQQANGRRDQQQQQQQQQQQVAIPMPRTEEEFEATLGDGWNWGMDVNASKPSATAGASQTVSRGNGKGNGKGNVGGVSTNTSHTTSTDSHGVESLGSTLNRQASLLMLLYPAAYCLLFSVSIIRIIDDLANPAANSKAQDVLHSIARWFIFAQGAFDAIIFQFIERHFRKRMKRRRKRALGEAVEDGPVRKAVGKVKAWSSTHSSTK